jgi:hypothetical protein
MNRRRFLSHSAAVAGGSLLCLPAAAQGSIREMAGSVRLNGIALGRFDDIHGGDTIATGTDGAIWFTVGGDAYFLRPRSELRLVSDRARSTLVSALRLLSGAVGATFARGAIRTLHTPTVTVGIRGTGVYLETDSQQTYACTCFGATDMMSAQGGDMMERVQVLAGHHQARRVSRDPTNGMRIAPAPFERHTSEEMIRLERHAGRPDPFVR